MFIFTAVLVPIIWAVNPWHLYRRYQRYKYDKATYITQARANKLMEDPEYVMGKRYGELL